MVHLVVCVLTCCQQLRCELSRYICWCLQQGRHDTHLVVVHIQAKYGQLLLLLVVLLLLLLIRHLPCATLST